MKDSPPKDLGEDEDSAEEYDSDDIEDELISKEEKQFNMFQQQIYPQQQQQINFNP